METTDLIRRFEDGLKSKSAETRRLTAQQLYHYLKIELKDNSADKMNRFLEELNQLIFELVSSNDNNERKGGILAIDCFICADICNVDSRLSRFANYLRKLIPANDNTVMEFAARTVGKLAAVSGSTNSSLYVEFELKRVLEWLHADRNETKIYAAILVLKEMAITTPTNFYQYIQTFFELIFKPLGDPKQYIREAAAKALRAALVVTGKRETTVQHPRPHWYTHCYQEITAMLGERGNGRDERLHGALLATNELLRSANARWEEKFNAAIKYVDIGARIRDFDYIKVLYPQVTNSFVKNILESIQTFNFNSDERPIIQSIFGHQLIAEHYDRICNDVMVLRLSKASFLQQAMLRILPRLAAFNIQQFVSGYLNLVINYLLILIKNREKDKNSALITLGLLALAAEEHILPYMTTIMTAVQTILAKIVDANSPSSKKNVLEPSFLIFLIMLTKALKSKFRAEIRTLTSQILLTTISKYVVLLLKTVIDEIPDLKVEVTDSLLRVLSSIVLQKPLLLQTTSMSAAAAAAAAVAASATSVSSSSLGLVRSVPITAQTAGINGSSGGLSTSSSGNSDNDFDKYLITLALHTLRSFDFHDVSMLHFVQKCAESFLENVDSEIRSEAIRTCVFLLRKSLESTVTRNSGRGSLWSSSSSSSRLLKTTTHDVLSKLLVIGLTDRDSEIRYLVFSSLTNCFDLYLAQSRIIDSLMIAVNDEVLEIREITMCILGRISTINPAYTYPILRKRLLQILVELEHTNIGRSKENATKILDHLVVNAPQFIIPYTEPILRTLVKKLKSKKSCKTTLTLELLQITGDLATVIGDCPILIEQMPELVPVLLELLNDSASAEKRGVAIWTLGQLQSAVGNRYCLYDHYPALLDTLISFLSTEQQAVTRREIIRVLGLIGAIDPYQHKINCGHFDPQQQSIVSISVSDTDNKDSIINLSLTANEMLVSMDSTCLEDYFHAVSLAVLMRIIKDPTLYQHHPMVIQAITFIFKSLNIKCVPYIPQVLPQFLSVVRNADNTFKEFLFQQLATLVFIVKYHIRSYLDEIFDIIKTHWTINGPLQSTVILLIEHIALALGHEFYDYIPRIINNIMVLLYYDTSKDKAVTVKVLRALQKFGNTLDKYMHLILSPIVSLFEAKNCPLVVPKTALESVECFSFSIDLSEFSAKIIHPLVRVLDGGQTELIPVAMNTLLAIMNQLGRRFRSFVPLVQSTLEKNNIVHSGYDVLLTKILNDQFCPESMTDKFKNLKKNFEVALAQSDLTTTVKKLSISTNSLRTAWIAARRVSKDDWVEWSRRLSLELLKESPSPALRACLALAQSYAQLPRDLFNAAFVCSWFELSQEIRNDIINVLEQTLKVPDLPEITQIVLNLAEFMEHCDEGPLPLDTHFLGQCAMNCRAYAKALHFKEKEFQRNPTAEVVEALISINNKLQQKDAAEGLLQFVMKRNGDISVQVRWYEKLNNWEKALLLYRDRLEIYPDENEALLGQMRCYEALGEWEELFEICKDTWSSVNKTESVQNIGRLATASAWNLNRWKDMAKYVECLPKESFDGAYYRAIIEINKKDYKKSQLYIDVSRAMLDTELTAMSTESYERAYGAMVSAQLLTELEEIIEYKLFPKKREILSTKWDQRLKNAQKLPTDWQRIMQLRSLVFSSAEDINKLLKYASLCRKNGNFNQSFKVMVRLLGFDPQTFPDKHFPIELPEVTLSYSKHLWMAGKRDEALKKLNTYIVDLSAPLPSTSASATATTAAKNPIESDEKRSLLGRCYLKLGMWTENVHGICPETIDSILKFYNSAKNYHPQSYKVWHKFGCMNFDTLQYYKGINEMIVNKNSVDKLPNGAKFTSVEKLSEFASASVHAFFKAIKLSNGKSLQDTLRLLTLWFEYGEWTAVYTAVMDGIKSIEIINWLQVIPQLIARIDSSNVLIGSLIQHILIDIGRVHPQALVYPLTVATKSSSNVRRQAANKILNILRENSTNLIDQVYVVSEELVRVAILWHELWYERLEEASRLYFGDKNIRGFLEILEPLHVLLERGPETLVENTFTEMYGHNLMEAHECCVKYKDSKNIKDLNKAWDIYYHVFQRIAKHLSQISVLELHNVSPKLLEARDLELAVPGSYVPNQPVIRISRFQKSLPIITSKQRPRKMCIIGSNGKEYFFLLKGHEDLRQDERVMQLFGLVNNLLLNNSSTFRKNLTIQRYAVIPLSTNSGLIGWVPNCDTLHTLIRDYREKKKTVLNHEHRLMIRMAPNYDHLPVVQKVEVFEHALEQTTGDDLARVLWLKSPTSEVWFNRRTNYTRSLAVMSMVGYILGLGDRHPSNIMLDRFSGKILHIDFGDCFEVAINREKFPEKIPFRLTRMLINAMEVTGIEGTYRKTCELVMAVLQRNRDSLMSVLEAFVYDPLFNWRLIDYTQEISDSKMKQTENLEESEIEQITANAKPFKDVLLLETTNARTTTSAAAFSDARDVIGTGGTGAGIGGIAGTTVGGGVGGVIGGGGSGGDNMASNSAPKDNIRPSIDKPKYPATSIKQRMANLKPDFVSKKVLAITHRVRDKLTGRDFLHEEELTIDRQVDLLIQQATNNENLCQCYIGWCPFW